MARRGDGADAGPPDLLEQGRDAPPRRPTAHQWRVALGALLGVTLLAAAGTLVVARVAAARADARDVKGLSLEAWVTMRELAEGSDAMLGLANKGPAGTLVVDVRLDLPGARTVEVGERLSRAGGTRVPLPVSSGACPLGLYTNLADTVLVHVRTRRGTGRLLRLALDRASADDLTSLLRSHCGFLRPDEGFLAELRRARRDGHLLTLDYLLQNGGSLPLFVDGFTGAPGLTVVAPTGSVTVPAGDGHNQRFGQRGLRVVLRVSNCRALLRFHERYPPEDDRPPLLTVRLRHRFGTGTGSLSLQEVREPVGHDWYDDLVLSCGGRVTVRPPGF